MKKIVVISDNHGDDNILEDIFMLEPHADYYIHCGDSETSYLENLEKFIAVKGNNDWHLNLPSFLQFTVDNFQIVVTHGHTFGYFSKEQAMKTFLSKHNAQVLISGHTHMPLFVEYEGVYLINPGSTTLPRGGSDKSYAVIEIEGHKIDCHFHSLFK